MEDTFMEVAGTEKMNLPSFWPNSPNNWFHLVEIQFQLRGITSQKSKFYHILSTIPPETCDRISDFLQRPPENNQYESLKQTLLERFAPSDERQLEALLSTQELGDRRPSEVLRHIRELAATKHLVSEKFIKSIWIRKMPELIRIALVAQPEATSLELLAKTADRMFDAINSGPQHRQIQSAQSTYQPQFISRQSRSPVQTNSGSGENRRSPSNSISITDRLARLEAKLDGLLRSGRNRSRGQRSPSRPRSSSNTRQSGMCWYHAKFGTAARRCNTPCNFRQFASTATMDVDTQQKNP